MKYAFECLKFQRNSDALYKLNCLWIRWRCSGDSSSVNRCVEQAYKWTSLCDCECRCADGALKNLLIVIWSERHKWHHSPDWTHHMSSICAILQWFKCRLWKPFWYYCSTFTDTHTHSRVSIGHCIGLHSFPEDYRINLTLLWIQSDSLHHSRSPSVKFSL